MYWHETSKADREKALSDNPTVGDFMKRFKQPPWCDYPEALSGIMGCWSLMECKINGESDCMGCDCHRTTEGTIRNEHI